MILVGEQGFACALPAAFDSPLAPGAARRLRTGAPGRPCLPGLCALEPSEMLRPRERALDRLRAAADEHAESGDTARRLCDSRTPDPRKLPERAFDGRVVGERADTAHAH